MTLRPILKRYGAAFVESIAVGSRSVGFSRHSLQLRWPQPDSLHIVLASADIRCSLHHSSTEVGTTDSHCLEP